MSKARDLNSVVNEAHNTFIEDTKKRLEDLYGCRTIVHPINPDNNVYSVEVMTGLPYSISGQGHTDGSYDYTYGYAISAIHGCPFIGSINEKLLAHWLKPKNMAAFEWHLQKMLDVFNAITKWDVEESEADNGNI